MGSSIFTNKDFNWPKRSYIFPFRGLLENLVDHFTPALMSWGGRGVRNGLYRASLWFLRTLIEREFVQLCYFFDWEREKVLLGERFRVNFLYLRILFEFPSFVFDLEWVKSMIWLSIVLICFVLFLLNWRMLINIIFFLLDWSIRFREAQIRSSNDH